MKYKVGDKVHLECTIVSVHGSVLNLSREHLENGIYGVHEPIVMTKIGTEHRAIVKHIPAPWVPAVGDVIVSCCGGHVKVDYTINSIVGDQAWVTWTATISGEKSDAIVPLHHYKLKGT